jgi:hypothetical protein
MDQFMNSNNIVLFPNNPVSTHSELTVESIKQNTDMMKHYHVQETISVLAPMVFNQLELAGFSVCEEDTETEDLKDGAFIIESIRSILCKHYGLYHPFQKIAEHVFSPDQEQTGALRIAESLNIVLKNTETN